MYLIIDLHRITFKIRLFLKLFLIQIGFVLLLIPLMDVFKGNLPSFLPDYGKGLKDALLFTLFFTAVLTPLFEEAVFRLGLSLRNETFAWGFIVSILFMLIFVASGSLIGIGIMICHLITMVVMYILKDAYKLSKLKKWFIALTTAYFGLMHLGNYDAAEVAESYLFIPLMISPQLVLGYCCSVVRLRINFMTAALFHGLYNGLLILLIVIF